MEGNSASQEATMEGISAGQEATLVASASEAPGSEGSGYAPNSPPPAKVPAPSKASRWSVDALPSLSVQILETPCLHWQVLWSLGPLSRW